MRLRLVALSLVGAFFLTLPLQAADDSQSSLDRLKSAADLTALDGSGLRPWHWKLDISLFDNEGKNPKTGSLEMWFSGGNLRSVESLGSKQITTLRIGKDLYRSAGDEKDMAGIRLIEMQALHPIPDEAIQPSTTVKLVQEAAGAIKLDCMVPTVAQQNADAIPGIQAVSFCFEQDTPKMLVTQEPGSFSVLRPRVGMFQSHQVPVELQIFAGTVMLSDAKTTVLATEPADPSIFQIQPGMAPVNAPVVLPAVDLRGLILSKNPPIFPPDAKEHHVAGAVIFDATIGKDGHVASLEPMAQSNAALIGSAKDAVSHWRFRPYLIDGIPVEVKTQLTVVYNPGGMGRGPGGGPGPGGGMPDGEGNSIKGR
jgi:hypothetical protein